MSPTTDDWPLRPNSTVNDDKRMIAICLAIIFRHPIEFFGAHVPQQRPLPRALCLWPPELGLVTQLACGESAHFAAAVILSVQPEQGFCALPAASPGFLHFRHEASLPSLQTVWQTGRYLLLEHRRQPLLLGTACPETSCRIGKYLHVRIH